MAHNSRILDRKPVAVLLAVWLARAAMAAETGAPSALPVGFPYSPPEWQTAICLPDDPHKSLVDRSGDLLCHYGQGGREFATRVGVEVTARDAWRKQELLSPRVPIVRTFLAAEGWEIVEEAFAVKDLRQPNQPPDSDALLADKLDSRAEARSVLSTQPEGPARNGVILVRVTNTGTESRAFQPRLIVDSTLEFTFQPEAQRVVVNGHETILSSLTMSGVDDATDPRRTIRLETLTVPAGQTATFFMLYCGGVCQSPASADPGERYPARRRPGSGRLSRWRHRGHPSRIHQSVLEPAGAARLRSSRSLAGQGRRGRRLSEGIRRLHGRLPQGGRA